MSRCSWNYVERSSQAPIDGAFRSGGVEADVGPPREAAAPNAILPLDSQAQGRSQRLVVLGVPGDTLTVNIRQVLLEI